MSIYFPVNQEDYSKDFKHFHVNFCVPVSLISHMYVMYFYENI